MLLSDVTEAHQMRLAAERNERLAAMGEMVAGLAHQLRTRWRRRCSTPATLVEQEMGPADRERIGSRAMERLRHLEKLIRDMLLVRPRRNLGREPFGICELVAELAQTLEPSAAPGGHCVFRRLPLRRHPVVGDRKRRSPAPLTNLLENAVQALEGRRRDPHFDARLDGPGGASRWPTTGAASSRPFSHGCSSRSSPPVPTVPAWAWRSRGGGPPTAATSASTPPGRGTTFTLTLAMGA